MDKNNEYLTTEVSEEDLANAVADNDDVLYSEDGLRLLKCINKKIDEYDIKEKTLVICDNAFSNCNELTEVTIPESVTTIGNYAFSGCSELTNVTIPNSVTSIGDGTFRNCHIFGKVLIPSSVTNIGLNPFCSIWGSCPIIEVANDNEYFCSVDGALFSKNMERLIGFFSSSHRSSTGTYKIPENVIKVCDSAFSYCKNINEVFIPSGVIEIGKSFTNCTKLTNFEVAEDNKCFRSKDGVLFTKDMMTLIQFPIASSITSYCVPEGVKKIDDFAFSGCKNLKEIILSISVIEIGKSFTNCAKLTNFEVAEDNKCFRSKDGVLFTKDMMTLIQFPMGFPQDSYCIPNSVTQIGERAFASCENLVKIIIPDGVTQIGDYAFRDCTNLRIIVSLNPEPPVCGKDVFKRIPINERISRAGDNISIHEGVDVPNGSKEAYLQAEGWKNFKFTTHIKELAKSTDVNFIDINSGITDEYGVLYSVGYVRLLQAENFSNSQYTIKNGTEVICDMAFYCCEKLAKIVIPDSVTEIGARAFENCSSLTRLTIPNSVKTIELDAFAGCISLRRVSIGKGVTQLKTGVLRNCVRLTEIEVAEDNSCFYDNDGVLFAKEPCKLICFPLDSPLLPSYVIPDGVTSIGDYSFCYCRGLTQVTIPDSVIEVGNSAFEGCEELSEVIIPDGVNVIGDGAFKNCVKLTKVTIPESVTKIGKEAFKNCQKLMDISFSNNFTEIGDHAFYGCQGPVKVSIPRNITEIGQSFEGCLGLKEIKIHNKVTKIGNFAFRGCRGLTKVLIPDSVTEIGDGAFKGCCELKEIIIPKGINEINPGVFMYCRGLTKVVIPDSVTEIGADAFTGCDAIQNFISLSPEPPIANSQFYFGLHTSCVLFVPYGAKNAYMSDRIWHKFPNIEETVDEEKFINMARVTEWDLNCAVYDGYGVLYSEDGEKLLKCNNTELDQYTIKEGTKVICDSAFRFCSSLEKITISESIIYIGESAFAECDKLGEITIPNGVRIIGGWAFYQCMRLSDVSISKSVYKIGEGAFMNCGRLVKLELPEDIVELGERLFENCVNLTNATIPNITMISPWMFCNCYSLESINIPDSVTEIGECAFDSCEGLKDISIPYAVTQIKESAFDGCKNIRHITSHSLEPPVCRLNVFRNFQTNTCTLYIPKGSKKFYSIAYAWHDFANIVEMECH